MHVYTSTLILLALLVILPDLYLYQRFMHNRTRRSTSVLHGVIALYFVITSLASMLNINHIYSPQTSFRMIMFVTVMGCIYLPKLVFCSFDLIFFLTGKRRRGIQYAGYAAALVTLGILIHGITSTRFHFEKGVYNVEVRHLPNSFEHFRIVQFSDTHLGGFSYSQERLKPLMDSINAQQPDLIVFTGDLVNNFATEANQWEEVFRRLDPTTPKLAILGNHDYSYYFNWDSQDESDLNSIAIRQRLRDFGFDLLMDDQRIIRRGNDSIVIIGTHNWGKKEATNHCNIQKALNGIEKYSTQILLTHDPTFWEDSIVGKTNIDLTLSGHTHAAQMGIEIGKLKLSPAALMFDCWDGQYEQDGQTIIVSRGIGCVGIPIRIGMNPQYSLIELTAKK